MTDVYNILNNSEIIHGIEMIQQVTVEQIYLSMYMFMAVFHS